MSETFSGDSGDEYEETIRQQRAENAALLASLDLQSGGSNIVDPERRRELDAQERNKKRISEQRKRAQQQSKENSKKRKVEAAPPATRSSSRLKGQTPAGLEEENKRIESERKVLEESRKQAQKLLHEKHELLALLGGQEDVGKAKAERLQELWDDVVRTGRSNVDHTQRDEKPDSKKDAFSILQQEFKDMTLLATNKVTPKRIYTAAFHPSTTRDVVFTGDKEGYISVWEPLAKRDTPGDGDDQKEDPEEPVTGSDGQTYNLRIPHDSSPISCIKIPSTQPNKLFSSSYNSTLRRIDIEKGISEEVFSFGADDDGDELDGALLSVFDFQKDNSHAGTGDSADDYTNPNIIWCGDHRGGVIRIDLREQSDTKGRGAKRGNADRGRNWQRWQVCEKKIGGLSLNPMNPFALSVASLDQSVHMFDTRRLVTKFESNVSIPATYKHVAVDELEEIQSDVWNSNGAQMGYNKSKQASTSVDWSPSGDQLGSVSYEDVVRIWDINQDHLHSIPTQGTSTPKKSTKPSSKPRSNGLMRYVKKEESPQSSSLPISNVLTDPKVIPHNNQTGKWLTLFRLRFSTNLSLPNHFTIGSMSRHCEIWSSDYKNPRIVKTLFDPVWTSAVQAVSTFHPSQSHKVVTGNASGRCLFWGNPQDE
ncbi:unnamed protein product [Sympodiomycopsis kandeliae]